MEGLGVASASATAASASAELSATDAGSSANSAGSSSADAGSSSAPFPKKPRLTKQEKKAQRKLLAIEKKKEWRERRKKSAQAKSADNAAKLAAHIASLDDAAREAFWVADKARRDRLYDEKVAQTARIQAAYDGGQRVVFDLSYGTKMSAKEQTSLARQLARSWGINRNAPAPVGLHLTGLGTCPVGCLPHAGDDIERWKVHRISEDVADAFPHEQLVFLSPDADEPLLELDPKLVYVIGGLVDSSVQKHTSYQKAKDLGARMMRLPLAEHAPEASARLPLTLTAVLDILLSLNNGLDWSTALTSAVAPRLLRAKTWENGRAARRAEARAKAAKQWGVEPRAPPPGCGGRPAEDEEEGEGEGEEDEEDEDEEDDEDDEDLKSEAAFLEAEAIKAGGGGAAAAAGSK